MIIMPFSSDQFSISHDAQEAGIAECLDPNSFSREELILKMEQALGEGIIGRVKDWSGRVNSAGPEKAVKTLVESL